LKSLLLLRLVQLLWALVLQQLVLLQVLGLQPKPLLATAALRALGARLALSFGRTSSPLTLALLEPPPRPSGRVLWCANEKVRSE